MSDELLGAAWREQTVERSSSEVVTSAQQTSHSSTREAVSMLDSLTLWLEVPLISCSHFFFHSFFVSVASIRFLYFSLNEKKKNIEMSCFDICKHSEKVRENFFRSLILFMRFSILHCKCHLHSSVECTTHLFKFTQDVYFLRCWLNWSLTDQTEVYKSCF